ncbi:hypothetical protein QTN25_010292 [Entamoeba marina]
MTAPWSQVDDTIRITTNVNVVNQPGWSVTQSDSIFFEIIFEAGCSSNLTLGSCPDDCIKQIKPTEDSFLTEFYF